MLESAIAWLTHAPWEQAVAVLLAENLLIFLLAIALGECAVRLFGHRRVSIPPPELSRQEVAIALSNVLLNTVITLVGLVLWRAGVIRFRTDAGVWAWLDILALLLAMDLAMYVLHRLAHHPWFFSWLHRMHHVYDRPRPLTLFILNPAENLAFGSLWLIMISLYQASWFGMSVYLALNVMFGTLGHLGVEPFPDLWTRLPLVRNVAGSTFHARHHQEVTCNYGFYTLIWDRLLGTLSPDYWRRFGQLPEEDNAGS